MPHFEVKSKDVQRGQDALPESRGLVEEARLRSSEERNLSSTSQTAYYAAASLGQLPYVSLPGVGTVVLRKCGWSC